MSKQIESLFKDLASGMSRRTALRRFFGGVAGAVAVAVTGRRVNAGPGGDCARWCADTYAGQGPAFVAACINASEQCPPGLCAAFFFISYGRDEDPDRPHPTDYTCVAI